MVLCNCAIPRPRLDTEGSAMETSHGDASAERQYSNAEGCSVRMDHPQ